MYFIYSVLIVLFFVVMSPYLVYQAVRYRKYVRSLPQRLGILPLSFNLDGDESIWIHAVSVGEVLTARALLQELRERYPRLRIFLSTTTITGHQVARNNLQYIDEVFYFPFDFAFIVRRTLRLVRPRLFVMMETELWPNLLRACHARGVKTLLVNGRISSRSYPRYKLARPFFRHVLAHVERFCMQSEESARRIIDMGADPARVTVTGSLKFDSLERPGASAPGDRGRNRVLRYFRITADRPVVIAASTLKGEEEPVLEAFQRLRATRANALLIIAPRKPERFDDVERLARRSGLNVARRTELRVDAEPRQDIVVLDTIGELAQLFQVATVVFVGGSLVDAGGHNILEPAVFGKPIIFGPYMQNFAEIARAFLDNGAGIEVKGARELETVLLELMADPVRRASLGAAARALVEANRGARARSLQAIAQLLQPEQQANVRMFRVK
ncbi:MAG TPA: 3-deoxy-D-manno-octulosonic acid transferase [Vicinamibacterales bacterium]|jgi:3-deoxy-D-manno-octulosonic-acid transferase|nr:3-deoxy-D-manno-octulosonic acid transferase [Vicinamibacterales bacterium]